MPRSGIAIGFAVVLSLVYPDPLKVEHASAGIIMAAFAINSKYWKQTGLPAAFLTAWSAASGQVYLLSILPSQEFPPDEPVLVRQKPVLKRL